MSARATEASHRSRDSSPEQFDDARSTAGTFTGGQSHHGAQGEDEEMDEHEQPATEEQDLPLVPHDSPQSTARFHVHLKSHGFTTGINCKYFEANLANGLGEWVGARVAGPRETTAETLRKCVEMGEIPVIVDDGQFETVPISSLILATDFATLEKSYKDNFGTVVRSGNFKTTVEFKPDPSQEQWEQGTVLMPVNLTKAYLSDAVKGDKLMVKKTTGNFSPGLVPLDRIRAKSREVKRNSTTDKDYLIKIVSEYDTVEAERDELKERAELAEKEVEDMKKQLRTLQGAHTRQVNELTAKLADFETGNKELMFQTAREKMAAQTYEAKYKEYKAKCVEYKTEYEELQVKHDDLLVRYQRLAAAGRAFTQEYHLIEGPTEPTVPAAINTRPHGPARRTIEAPAAQQAREESVTPVSIETITPAEGTPNKDKPEEVVPVRKPEEPEQPVDDDAPMEDLTERRERADSPELVTNDLSQRAATMPGPMNPAAQSPKPASSKAPEQAQQQQQHKEPPQVAAPKVVKPAAAPSTQSAPPGAQSDGLAESDAETGAAKKKEGAFKILKQILERKFGKKTGEFNRRQAMYQVGKSDDPNVKTTRGRINSLWAKLKNLTDDEKQKRFIEELNKEFPLILGNATNSNSSRQASVEPVAGPSRSPKAAAPAPAPAPTLDSDSDSDTDNAGPKMTSLRNTSTTVPAPSGSAAAKRKATTRSDEEEQPSRKKPAPANIFHKKPAAATQTKGKTTSTQAVVIIDSDDDEEEEQQAKTKPAKAQPTKPTKTSKAVEPPRRKLDRSNRKRASPEHSSEDDSSESGSQAEEGSEDEEGEREYGNDDDEEESEDASWRGDEDDEEQDEAPPARRRLGGDEKRSRGRARQEIWSDGDEEDDEEDSD